MRNITSTVSADGKKLTLEIDLTAQKEPSASGKSLVIASTEGNVSIDEAHPEIKMGINIYTKK
jgi:hypothetical protein